MRCAAFFGDTSSTSLDGLIRPKDRHDEAVKFFEKEDFSRLMAGVLIVKVGALRGADKFQVASGFCVDARV